MTEYRWGVAYVFDEDGEPLQNFVEESDDEQDARDWAQASGDPDAKVVRASLFPGPWKVTE
jgi:hypothetical protein